MGDQVGEETSATFKPTEEPSLSEAERAGETLSEPEPALPELFQSIHEGAQMLVDSREKDSMLSRELCASLVAYTKWLGSSLELAPESIPELYGAERISLSTEGELVVTMESNVSSKPLEEYPSEVVMTVVLDALPQLQSAIRGQVQRLDERISLFDRITRELRDLPTALDGPGGELQSKRKSLI